MIPEEIQQIIDFVEGRLTPKEFEDILYKNPRFEEVLNDNPGVSLNAPIWSNLYLFVIEQNFNAPGGILSVHAVLAEFLAKHGFPSRPIKSYSERYDLILSAQPKWLYVDDAYIQKEIMPAAGERQGKELKEWLRSELLRRFRYDNKPPRWIQNPNWPIGANGPLMFLGQIKVLNYFHDEAAIYIFHDSKSGEFHNVYQAR